MKKVRDYLHLGNIWPEKARKKLQSLSGTAHFSRKRLWVFISNPLLVPLGVLVDISNKSMWFNRLFFLLTAVVLPALGYLSVSALIDKYQLLQPSDLQKKKAKNGRRSSFACRVFQDIAQEST